MILTEMSYPGPTEAILITAGQFFRTNVPVHLKKKKKIIKELKEKNLGGKRPKPPETFATHLHILFLSECNTIFIFNNFSEKLSCVKIAKTQPVASFLNKQLYFLTF